ncbi:MAG: F0F1 ATP synthase subunit A [Bacteriovoracaceae bacterium]|nr:F0F1 ATP synthase subunit A [Bacteriovoracaceae bacterium]
MKKIVLCMFFSQKLYASEGVTWYSLVKEQVALPEHVVTCFLVGLLLTCFGLVYRYKLFKNKNVVYPDRAITFRNIVDIYGKFIMSQAIAILGEDRAKKYFSFIATIFILILLSNLVGLVPGFLPPTEHVSTTLALGLFSFIYYNYKGVRANGVVNYLKHFAGPMWYLAILIFPIELISHCFRPITLALRLRGNIMGDHLVLSTFYSMTPWIIPIFFLTFGILVSIVQAYVFTILSMVYISLATSHD